MLKPVYEWMEKTDVNTSDDSVKLSTRVTKECAHGKKPLKPKVKPRTKTKQVKNTRQSNELDGTTKKSDTHTLMLIIRRFM